MFVENGLPVDASLSPDTKKHLQNLVLQQGGTVPSSLEVIDGPSALEHDQMSDRVPETSPETSAVSRASSLKVSQFLGLFPDS